MGTNYPRDDDEPNDRQTVSARAEYRSGDDAPLVITLNVSGHVLDVSGGFKKLTDSVRLRPATDE